MAQKPLEISEGAYERAMRGETFPVRVGDQIYELGADSLPLSDQVFLSEHGTGDALDESTYVGVQMGQIVMERLRGEL